MFTKKVLADAAGMTKVIIRSFWWRSS
jgi:hypothetical protein